MTVNIALLLATVAGVATNYTADAHYGNPLFCDTWDTELAYNENTNFVAIPVSWYESGDWSCFDDVIITFEDGTRLYSKALDAGPFGSNFVDIKGELVPIVVDIPSHEWSYKGISARASILNVSLVNRMLQQNTKIGYKWH